VDYLEKGKSIDLDQPIDPSILTIQKIKKSNYGAKVTTINAVNFLPINFIEIKDLCSESDNNPDCNINTTLLYGILSEIEQQPLDIPPLINTNDATSPPIAALGLSVENLGFAPPQTALQNRIMTMINHFKKIIIDEILKIVKDNVKDFFSDDQKLESFITKYKTKFIDILSPINRSNEILKAELRSKIDKYIDGILKQIPVTEKLNFKIFRDIIKEEDFYFGTEYYSDSYDKIDISEIYYYGNPTDSSTENIDNLLNGDILKGIEGYDINIFLNNSFYGKIITILNSIILTYIGQTCNPSEGCNMINFKNLLNSSIDLMNEKRKNDKVVSTTKVSIPTELVDPVRGVSNKRDMTVNNRDRTVNKPPVPKNNPPGNAPSIGSVIVPSETTVGSPLTETSEFKKYSEHLNSIKVSLQNRFHLDSNFLDSNFLDSINFSKIGRKYIAGNYYPEDYEKMLWFAKQTFANNPKREDLIVPLKKMIMERVNQYIKTLKRESDAKITIFWLISYLNFLFDCKILDCEEYYNLLKDTYDKYETAKVLAENEFKQLERDEYFTLSDSLRNVVRNELYIHMIGLSWLDFNELEKDALSNIKLIPIKDVYSYKKYKKVSEIEKKADKIIKLKKMERFLCIKKQYNKNFIETQEGTPIIGNVVPD